MPQRGMKGGQRGGVPAMRDGPYMIGPGPLQPHPALLARGPAPLAMHPALLEEKLMLQHQEIQALLVENQRLGATHAALRQELVAAQQGLQHLNHVASDMQEDKEHHLREVYEKSMKLEADLRGAEPMKAELLQLQDDAQKLVAVRQELTAQVQALTQDLARARADLQQLPALRSEIESYHQDLERARAAIDYQKRLRVEQQEQGQAMEQHLISMAREVEKLRAQLANADKRGRTDGSPDGARGLGPGPAYGGNFGNPEVGFAGGSYADVYGNYPVQGVSEGGAQYGDGGASLGAYDMQRTHARR